MEKGQRLGILQKPEFLQYLKNLPTQRLAILGSINLETGDVKMVESRQVGNSPPETRVIFEESKGEE